VASRLKCRTPAAGSPRTYHAVLAGFLGWTLDAFDFFIVVFLFDTLAHQFGVSKKEIVLTTTATLAMRPIGALLLGCLRTATGAASAHGQRDLLFGDRVDVRLFAQLHGVHHPPRAVWHRHGWRMGRWRIARDGSGAGALAGHPQRILQSGYSIGYLLAAIAQGFSCWCGMAPHVLDRRAARATRALYPDESAGIGGVEAASRGEHGQVLRIVAGEWKRFSYLVVLMTFMMFLSHGTQDLYPDFLKEVHKISSAMVANIAMIYNVGAVVGAIVFGHISQVAGRRKGMIAALGLSLLMIPLWAFGSGLPAILVAALLMQAGVQGAWGVIPVHLNELSADAARA